MAHRLVLILVAALLVAGPASALVAVDAGVARNVKTDDPSPRTSCAITALDSPGSGVQPFVDPAATGARVGTEAGSVTVAVYPYACSYVIFQLANPNRPIPREPLPEDMPHRGEFQPVFDALGLVLP